DGITVEDCGWSEITAFPELSWEFDENAPVALDTTRVKTAPFDAAVLADAHFFICYETVNRQSGDVTFESAAMKLLVFEKGGEGYLLDDGGAQRSFSYAMDSDYSCVLRFDDGGEGTLGLCADQGGALPGSEEGSLWLQLYLGDKVLWFY
ncbi:MAG: hypothetical protein J5449_08125, partial [Oscillospiraceae bacterium]|nr:hypothetical protein [Oscillospiraceae bacterium]